MYTSSKSAANGTETKMHTDTDNVRDRKTPQVALRRWLCNVLVALEGNFYDLATR